MKLTALLIVPAAFSLLACGKPEDAAAPADRHAAAESSQSALAPAARPPEASPAALTEAPPAPLAPSTEARTAVPAAPSPAAAKPAEAPTAPSAPAASLAQPDLSHGQQIYRQACAFCHDKGVAGAPKIGDAAAWSPRLAQGIDALHASALGGKGAMPAKGGNPALANSDVRAAVDYLVAQVR